MPKISQFYGIIISMNYSDYPPPHFHVHYAGRKATVSIRSGQILEGELPNRAFGWFTSGGNCGGVNWKRIGRGTGAIATFAHRAFVK